MSKVIFTTSTTTNGSFPRIQKYTTAGGHRWLGGGFSDSWVYSSSTTISTSNWYLYSQLYDGTEAVAANGINMWLDGSTQTVNTGGGSVQANTGTVTRCHVGNWRTGSHNFDGSIPELILYNTELNEAQRRIVENYLAAKYGLTIANDLYAFEGTFGFELAGIGRDDINNFHQDAQGSGLVRINTPSDMDDGEYLLWGHDDVALHDGTFTAPWTGNLPVGVDNALHRVWRVDETGDLGTVTVMVDVTGFVIGSSGSLVLMIDSDYGDFANAATIPISSFAAPYAIFDLVDFADGDYFTLGSLVSGNELPIELISFSAEPVEDAVELTWVTASEINNDYFSLERSKDAFNWESIAQIEGAGNSTSTLTYQFIDYEPINGTSFYQLKQTDFNGDFALSNIAIVQYESTDNDIQIYPNPTEGLITIFAKEEELDQIKIYNIIGQDITNQTVINYISDTQMSVDLSGLSSGYYFVRTKSQINKISKE